MSRISFKTDGGLTVVAGWDVPLQGYFLSVFDDANEDELTYESLDDRNTRMGFRRDSAYFKDILVKLGIEAPIGFWELVEENEGNVFYTFRNDGWVRR
jgi:hypothetical protein